MVPARQRRKAPRATAMTTIPLRRFSLCRLRRVRRRRMAPVGFSKGSVMAAPPSFPG